MITFQLIRHGKTKGNLEKRFTGGRTDEPLCLLGIQEIEENVSENIYLKTDLCFSSPMERCRQTAAIIFSKKDIVTIEELREIDFGIFENKNHKELDGTPEYQKWLDSGGKENFSCGENFSDFTERTVEGFSKMISSANGKTVSAVVHGGTIMAILAAFNGRNYYDYFCSNGHGYIFEFDEEKKQLQNLRKI